MAGNPYSITQTFLNSGNKKKRRKKQSKGNAQCWKKVGLVHISKSLIKVKEEDARITAENNEQILG